MDEFSDFQMAVGPHSSRGGDGLKAQNGLWVLEHSSRNSTAFPVQTVNNSSARSPFEGFGHHQFNSFTPNTNKHGVRFVPPPPTGSTDKYSVGSRLANYDLGMRQSVPAEDSFGILDSVKSNFSHPSSGTLSNGGSVSRNHCGGNSGPNLLIGEEDKYAALRVLVNVDSKDHELNEKQTFSDHSFVNAQEGIGTETDFGDFQSFSGTQPDFFESNLIGTVSSFDLSKKPLLNNIKKLAGFADSNSKDLISTDEFGDFVSVEQTSIQNTSSSNLKEIKPTTDCFEDLLGSQWNSETEKNPSTDFDWLSTLTNNSHHKSQGISKISDVDRSHSCIENPTSPEYLSSINFQETFNQEQASKTLLPLPLVSTKIEILDASESSARCASFNEINHDSLELSFYGQKDVFNSCLNTRHPSIDISPESRSIASLDLGNYCTSNENCDIGRNPEQVFPYESDEMVGKDAVLTMGLPFEPSKSVQQYDFYKANNTLHSSSSPTNSKDKYQCFKEELDTDKEKCLAAWIRCLKSCKNLLNQAIELFNVAPSSNVIREIVSEEKGSGYVKNLVAVYRVHCRLMKSISRAGESNRVGDIENEIQNGWDTLISLFLGTSVMGILTTSADDLSISTSCEQQKLCGVCKNQEDSWDDFVECEGNTYHSSCANLWINVLDTNLPLLPQIPF